MWIINYFYKISLICSRFVWDHLWKGIELHGSIFPWFHEECISFFSLLLWAFSPLRSTMGVKKWMIDFEFRAAGMLAIFTIHWRSYRIISDRLIVSTSGQNAFFIPRFRELWIIVLTQNEQWPQKHHLDGNRCAPNTTSIACIIYLVND